MIPDKLISFVESLDRFDWFSDAEMDKYGNLVIYVNKMDLAFIGNCPNDIAGTHVLFHFAASQPVSKTVPATLKLPIQEPEFLDDVDVEADIDDLIMELDRLEKICGSNILQDVFYEIHDGRNAVTNHSAKFPEVREALDKLYFQYGFDVIYEELDG